MHVGRVGKACHHGQDTRGRCLLAEQGLARVVALGKLHSQAKRHLVHCESFLLMVAEQKNAWEHLHAQNHCITQNNV